MRGYRRQGLFKVFVLTIFSIAFWFSLYRIFLFVFWLLARTIPDDSFVNRLITSVFHIFFLVLTLMLIFSNAIIGYGSYFRSKETGFLFSMPVRSESIFLYKFTESLAFSSWAFVFLGTPLMAAYAIHYKLSFLFILQTLPFLIVYLLVPAAIGAILVMLITVYIPRSRKSLIMAVVFTAGLIIIYIAGSLLMMKGSFRQSMSWLQQMIEGVEFMRNPLLPSAWIAKGIILLGKGQYAGAYFYLGVIAANAMFLCVIAWAMSGRFIQRGWFITQSLKSTRRFVGREWIEMIFRVGMPGIGKYLRTLVVKDMKSFIRDPVQWSQFLIFFGLLAVYFLNLRTFSYEDQSMMMKNLISQMNLLATSLTLSTFASRFIFPQLSLEGRRFWIVGMIPMNREDILYGKLTLSFTSSLVVGQFLIALSSFMLGTPAMIYILHVVSLFGICLGISGLAVGLGAIYPNFAEDNPSKIVAGFGGTLNLVMSLLFVLLVLVIQAVPCFLYFSVTRGVGIGPGTFRLMIVGAMVLIAVVSLFTCLVPMNRGLRAIRELDV
jgi:ABC-2 type transport system permease protein